MRRQNLKDYKLPLSWQRGKNLIYEISRVKSEPDAEEYQTLIYKNGKNVYPENLRSWFISLYQILFGSENGPRLGSLFYLYKKEKVLQILKAVID